MRKSKTAILLTEHEQLDIETWLEEVAAHYYHPSEQYSLKQAYELARLVSAGQVTPSGFSCLHQGLLIAETLIELNLDAETAAAALCLPSVQYAELNIEDIKEQLTPQIAQLIQGVQQMNAIHSIHERVNRQHQFAKESIDNLRKMLLAMVSDVRIVIIKLAERLCVLRYCKTVNSPDQQCIAKEAMDIYAPLANRLGIGHLKWELEDLAFRYLDPESYKAISKSLNVKRDERIQYVKNIITELEQLLSAHGIKQANITGRVKHIYSIYRKMQRKRININEIYDATAVRILVSNISDCYAALSLVHARWQHIPKEFDDYIAHPKPNGYRSIHTAVIGPDNNHIEIQIRTYKLHDEAELGVAAHWKYKEGRSKQSDYEQKIAWLRQLMDWQKEVSQTSPATNSAQQMFDDRVYVLTPNGDVVDLPKGATPLDFAYHIHSDVGHRCRGAKINGALVNLTYTLKTGDRVEILTSKENKPSRDWLNPQLHYLTTTRAKAKVHHWFRKQEHERNLAMGQELFDKEVKRLGLKKFDQMQIAKRFNFYRFDELLAALGRGDLRIPSVINAIQAEYKQKEQPAEMIPVISRQKSSQIPHDINVSGVGNLLTHMAKCCHPIPGDPIIGYVTLGKGVSIHRQDCASLVRKQEKYHDRIVDANWGQNPQNKYPVGISIDAYDRHGLVRDISHLLVNEKISIIGLTCTTNTKNNTAHINLTIEIDNLDPLNRILHKIQQLSNVLNAKRQY